MTTADIETPTTASAPLRNGILVFAGGMALAAVSFVAEHFIVKAARKL